MTKLVFSRGARSIKVYPAHDYEIARRAIRTSFNDLKEVFPGLVSSPTARMKRFFNGRKGENAPPPPDEHDDETSRAKTRGNSVISESSSIDEFKPIFNEGSSTSAPSFSFKNDPSLNLNPSILNSKTSPSVFTKDSEFSKSVFSHSKHTFSTKQSSYMSNQSNKKSSSAPNFRDYDYGQPLQILDIAEESKEVTNPQESILDKLHEIYQDISYILNQFNTSSINLTTAVINTIECLKKFLSYMGDLSANIESDSQLSWNFSTYNNTDLRKIMKIYLNYYDNLLNDDVYIKLKLLLLKNFNDFAKLLNSNYSNICLNSQSVIKPQNYAIGINQGESLPNEDSLTKIIDRIASTPISIKDQNGSFIAPIVRGISKELNILCLYFGYPNPNEYHTNLTKSLHDLYDDIHVLVVKNRIELASASTSTSIYNTPHQSPIPPSSIQTPPTSVPVQKFKLPFRNPNDSIQPPMSLSLSIESSARTSGTMGGFIYPKINLKKQPNLSSYANSKFAISCGHVCLDKHEDNVEYPHVSAPSSVLINLYKTALLTQYQKFNNHLNNPDSVSNDISVMEAKTAYGSALNQLDQLFPVRKIKVYDNKFKQERWETRNFPRHRFGQIIWGERNLIHAKKTKDGQQLNEKRLSDIAIIKVNKIIKCDSNFLGDDIAFNEYDPSLMFDNLYVRKVVQLTRRAKEISIDNLNDVDSSVSSFSSLTSNDGIPVFKYGSTTKFTAGNLNGIKLVYWLDGAIHSSEFVVNSIEKNSSFAAGGDSGSWILSKLEDVPTVSDSKGLGVLGMLHSYDGEFKQFGLFTPMTEILDRLEEVTNIKWGVVGVQEKHDADAASSDVSDSDSFDDGDDDSDADSHFDGAIPPDVE